MAEVVVNLLVENLTQLLKENIQLISGLKDDVERLLEDLGDFKAFLREAGKARYDNEILKRHITKIRVVVNKAEDLIDKYVVDSKFHYDKKWKRYMDIDHPGRKKELAEKIRSVRETMKNIRQETSYDINVLREEALPNRGAGQAKVPTVEEEHVVGFDGEVDAIVKRLTEGEGFEVISIVGMPGLGKTTLANKIFKDERVEYYFMNRAWIYVSGVYKRRDVFLRILKELSKLSNSYPDIMSDEDLAKEIKNILGSAKYFIVMDDVWTVEDWNALKIAFPMNNGSRVLVSTRHEVVARHANSKEINTSRQPDTCRRLCVQRNASEFLSSSLSAEHIRSLLCFSSSKYDLAAEKVQFIRDSFPLLRVLHTAPDESIILTRFPKDLTKLFHLRYIAISTTLKILPQGIDSLWNMQTLIVRTTQSTLDIKGDIWKMTRLRHVQTNSSAQLLPPSSNTKKDPFANRNLQTLSRISPESCTAVALAKAPNLNNLGIQGNLAKLFETNKDTGPSLFKNLGELKLLEKLKLLNHGGNVQRLPQKYEFPQKIKKLTLSNTHLEWTELSILGSLEYLEVLKLTENAFKGEEWEPSKGGFPCLQFLRIERTDLKSWKASSLHFPLLKSLILRQCLYLEEVPPSLADIDNLQEMELNRTNPRAAQSAWNILQIKQVKEKELKEKGGSPRRFKLNIYPPDELEQIQQI
nr:putative late blight resistance protein homolog R1B-14 [Ipomoea batatas]